MNRGSWHKSESLTIKERAKLLQEYQSLPRTGKNHVQKGFTDLLCRKWGVSRGQLHKLLEVMNREANHAAV